MLLIQKFWCYENIMNFCNHFFKVNCYRILNFIHTVTYYRLHYIFGDFCLINVYTVLINLNMSLTSIKKSDTTSFCFCLWHTVENYDFFCNSWQDRCFSLYSKVIDETVNLPVKRGPWMFLKEVSEWPGTNAISQMT